MKVLQKRTRNIAALGMAPALAGKLRHALEGMRVPLEDNQRFRVSLTSSCLQSQENQKVGSPPPPSPHTTASADGRTEEYLDGRLQTALRSDCGGSRVGLQGSFQRSTVAKSRTVICSAGEISPPKGLSPPQGTHPMGIHYTGAMEPLEHEQRPL